MWFILGFIYSVALWCLFYLSHVYLKDLSVILCLRSNVLSPWFSHEALQKCKQNIEMIANTLELEGFSRIDAFVNVDSGEVRFQTSIFPSFLCWNMSNVQALKDFFMWTENIRFSSLTPVHNLVVNFLFIFTVAIIFCNKKHH